MTVATTTAHPAFRCFSRWLLDADVAGDIDRVSLERLNAWADVASPRPVSATGASIRFVPAMSPLAALEYETSIHDRGEVATRQGVRHDALNALCWLSFPRLKRQCNALHIAQAERDDGQRGAVRDAATLFDESGVVALCRDRELAELLKARQWKALFCDRRAEAQWALAFFVCGHAVLEKLLNPYPAITTRVLIVPFVESLDVSQDHLRIEADRRAAQLIDTLHAPHDLPPLPLAGIPGWDPRNADPAFYDDTNIFRPARA